LARAGDKLGTLPGRVVVTGGCGFIGLHTVRRLDSEGIKVLVLDDQRHACGESLPPGVDLEQTDITAPDAAATIRRFQPEAILHLAAQGGVSRSVRDPVGDALMNVVGTVAMLKAAVDIRCRRFVFASSGGAIYGHAPRLPAPESTTPRPLSPYGAAKLAAEGYLGMFSRTFGLSTLALRYSNVYGPFQDGTGEAGVVAITCERLVTASPPEIRGDGKQSRDFIFVADVVEANLRALRANHEGVMNIGTGIATSVLTVVGHLTAAAAYSGRISFVDARAGEVRDVALDVRRAGRLLGWKASVLLPDGLRQTFMSFRERAARRAPAIDAPAGA
jgi:UDP-glucose 4-epimerase